MTLLHQFVLDSADRAPDATALIHRRESLDYQTLASQLISCAKGFMALDLVSGDRVGVYLPKQTESVIGLFGASLAGGVFVPINPLLKPLQVAHIVKDCEVKILVTSASRAELLAEVLPDCPSIQSIVVVDTAAKLPANPGIQQISWADLLDQSTPAWTPPNRIDADVVSILYTSGSTGKPKGVVLSHRNMVEGARSVAQYLNNTAEDRLLAVLPFSFDYGLSQLTTAFLVGASVVLMDYLLPQDVIKAVVRHEVTGLAAVPPLWTQLAQREWPEDAQRSLRYITNSGGAVPPSLSRALSEHLPNTDIYLMYGLTEAFRSTYLPPEQLKIRPESIGKAIPNAQVMVVREDGSECGPDEPGELVHRGALVSLGYWNDGEKTAIRFKPAPGQPKELVHPELAVWSGDQVKKDAEGYLYFIGRKDEMIKTSGYRVSPTEVEDTVFASGLVGQVAAIGAPHATLGQAILLAVESAAGDDQEALLRYCKIQLPAYMVPLAIVHMDALPRNANGKIDRAGLSARFKHHFQPETS